MIRRLLFSLIFALVLALPAYSTIAPENGPAPETDKTSPPPEQQERVIVITTAKDPKVDKITVGKHGEIIVPQSKDGTTTGSATFQHSRAATGRFQPRSAHKGTKSSDNLRRSKDAGDYSSASDTGAGGSELSTTGNEENQEPDSLYPGADSSGGIPFGGVPFGFAPGTSSTPPVSPTLPTAQLQALLNQSVYGTGVPGAVMMVRTRWGTWTGAAGYADLAAGQAVTTDMQVNLAACTKLFTASLIMKLVEANKLALTDTVEKWLPGQVIPGGDQAAAQKITVGMLLNHTSGLHDHETIQPFEDQLFSAPTDSWSNADVLALINSSPLDFAPGTACTYCNSNYYLLGMIAEAATGDTVQHLMQTHFFTPRGMTRTLLSRGGQKTAPYIRNYCWFGIPLYPNLTDTSGWDLSWDWTSGSGVSTAKDMLTWLMDLFGYLTVVSPQSLQMMTTPQAPSTVYGYGLEVANPDSWYGEKLYYHYGENPGVLTCWLYYPTSGRIIFIALNRDDKRFLTTDPPQQKDANQVATYLLNGVSSLLISTNSQ
jgi:D-alanyl-D-alanine carboxypeptidase